MDFYNYKNNLEFKRDIFCAENIEQKHRLTYKTVLGKKSNSFFRTSKVFRTFKRRHTNFSNFSKLKESKQ